MKCSVIMTCYNEGAYIEAAVRSVLEQTRVDIVDRIVIVDDASEAPTLDVLARISTWDQRIHIEYGTGGAGVARNRNIAVRLCDGPLIAFLDGDDLWVKEKLERQLPLFDDPEVGFAYTGLFVFASPDLATAHPVRLRRIPTDKPLPLAYFLNDPPIVPSTLMVRRVLFEQLDGFTEEIRVFEDTDFCLRAAQRTRFASLDEPLLYKRNHPMSITARSNDMLMHHANVAFRFAKSYPDALPYVPVRLAQRATKLGNVAMYAGDVASARRFYRFALAQNFFNPIALAGVTLTSAIGRPLLWLMGPIRRRRAAAIGPRSV
jgi:glycosyltransferase involved in cell wall biosynthesis